MTFILGKGILSWDRGERISDRYGTVNLRESLDGDDGYLELAKPKRMAQGRLVARILETRQSGHIGDLARGIVPSTPEVGEEIELGQGELFFEDRHTVGLKPSDDRHSDWLDPKALYRCHEQTVELLFEVKS